MASAPTQAKMDIGRVLGLGFTALRANFPAFLAVSLLLAGLPGFAVQYWISSSLGLVDPNGTATGAFWAVAGGSLLVSIVSTTLLQGVLARSTILHLSGRHADVGASAVLALRLLPSLIGLSLVLAVMIGVGLVLLIFPGLMVYCATLVAVPALVEERRSIFASIGRSRDLTRGSRWSIFLLAILFWVFSTIVQGVVGLFSGGGLRINPQDPLGVAIASGIGASVSTLIMAVLVAALYVELREVREGASVNQLADVFG
jgi:hypothetical protein